MLKTRVMPVLLLSGTSLVKTVKFRNPGYLGDPINAVRIYNEMEVDELVFLDIMATIENRRPSFSLIHEIAGECFMPLAYGGGISRTEDIRDLFKVGVEKVAINSYAVAHPEFITEAADLFGSQSIIVSIDVKRSLFGKYEIHINGGKKNTHLDPVSFAVQMQQVGAGELLLNSIDRDGTWEGYDTDLLKKVTSAVSIPVIACGGAGSIEDFGSAVKQGGASAVGAGSMVVYQGKDLGVLIKFPKKADLERILA
jgi:imidazole glycerol-phosphate synthase subunit HisF